MIAEEVVGAAGLGLVVTKDDAVTWLNDAARDLVASCGGGWSGPGSPLGALRCAWVSPTIASWSRWPAAATTMFGFV